MFVDYDPVVTESLAKLIDLLINNLKLKIFHLMNWLLEWGLPRISKLMEVLLASSGGMLRQLLKVVMNYNSCYEKSPFPTTIQVKVPKN